MNYKNASNAPDEVTKSLSFKRISETESLKLHELVRKRISEAIIEGRWRAGEVLPSEVALANDFGVSVGTVRKALSTLTSEGVLMRRRKTGTVVTGWTKLLNLSHFYRYFRLHDKQGRLLKSRAVLIGYVRGRASAYEAEKLELQKAEAVFRLRRVRYVDGRAAMIDSFVFAEKLVPDFPDEPDVPELLYLFLFEKYGIRVAAVRENITAELAGPKEAALLELKQPHALLKFEELAFDHLARPIIYAIHHAATTHFQYISEIR